MRFDELSKQAKETALKEIEKDKRFAMITMSDFQISLKQMFKNSLSGLGDSPTTLITGDEIDNVIHVVYHTEKDKEFASRLYDIAYENKINKIILDCRDGSAIITLNHFADMDDSKDIKRFKKDLQEWFDKRVEHISKYYMNLLNYYASDKHKLYLAGNYGTEFTEEGKLIAVKYMGGK